MTLEVKHVLYNSVVVIGANGSVLNVHRKLMPTNPERMVWGFGDGRAHRPDLRHGPALARDDAERVGFARRSLAVIGHYSRPNIFRLHVKNERLWNQTQVHGS